MPRDPSYPPASQEPGYISFEGLAKQFSHQWAVREASGEIKSGDRIAISGKNGAGKSTLLGLLAGFYTPTKGSIRREQNKSAGFIAHESMFYTKLTAYENLFFLKTLTPDIQKEEIALACEFAGLSGFRDERVETFSHGMKKRLSIARTMLQKPSLLFLDEGFSGLDWEGKGLLSSVLRGGAFRRFTGRLIHCFLSNTTPTSAGSFAIISG